MADRPEMRAWAEEAQAQAARAERAEAARDEALKKINVVCDVLNGAQAALAKAQPVIDAARKVASWTLAYEELTEAVAALDGTEEQRPAEHGDQVCAKCGAANIVWFTPDNELWNFVEATAGKDVLCVTCFVRIAEDVLTPVPPAWMVMPEPRPEFDGRWVWQSAQRSERSEEPKSIDEKPKVYAVECPSCFTRTDAHKGWCAFGQQHTIRPFPPVPSGTGEQPEES